MESLIIQRISSIFLIYSTKMNTTENFLGFTLLKVFNVLNFILLFA